MRPRASWFPLVVAAFVATACANATAPDPERITELPRPLTASEQSLIAASNTFGLDLARRVAASDRRPNLVLSPLSASMALGMTLNGANGSTFEGMRAALGFASLSRDEINASYRELITLLTSLDPAVRFEIANAIWAREGVPFHQAFFDATSAAFGARAESRDFADPATVQAINAWVRERTNGLIDSIVDRLDPALVMLLVNAIYFDGDWTTQFDPAATRSQRFTREDGSTIDVDMMSRTDATVPMAVGPDYSAVELPYGGETFSMVLLLPAQGSSARSVLAALDSGAWDALTRGLTPRELDIVSIPKLTLTFEAYLNDALQAMGMAAAFRPGADFTRMSPIGDRLCIDFVRQKTFLEVDERGTRAAAVTSVGVGITSFSGFVVDRPFVFAIRERLSGTLLFVGLVGDPRAEDRGPDTPTSDCG